jgi:hypothetical protein
VHLQSSFVQSLQSHASQLQATALLQSHSVQSHSSLAQSSQSHASQAHTASEEMSKELTGTVDALSFSASPQPVNEKQKTNANRSAAAGK